MNLCKNNQQYQMMYDHFGLECNINWVKKNITTKKNSNLCEYLIFNYMYEQININVHQNSSADYLAGDK